MRRLKNLKYVGLVVVVVAAGLGGGANANSWEPTSTLEQSNSSTLWPSAMPPGSVPITVSVQGSGTYDSNAVRGSAAYAAHLGVPLNDWSFAPEAQLEFVRTNGRIAGFLHVLGNYNFYSRDTVLDYGRMEANGGLQARFARCVVGLESDFQYHQTNFQDEPVLLVNNNESTESIGINGNCPRPIGFAPVASFNSEWGQYTAAALKSSNFRVYDAVGGASYSRPVLGTVSLYGEYRNAAYPNRDILLGGGGLTKDGYNSYSGGLRIERAIGARMSGSAHIAYTSLVPSTSASAKFRGITYGAELSYKVSPKLRLHGQFDRDTVPSIVPTSTFEVRRRLDGSLLYQLNRRISIEVGAGDVSRSYEGSALLSGATAVHDEAVDGYGAVHVPVGRRFEIVLRGTHEHRDSSLPEFTYTSNRATLSVAATF